MQINLTDVLSCDGKVIHRMVHTELTSFDSALGSFPVTEKAPFQLTISNLGSNKLRIEGEERLAIRIPCDRCLKEVLTPFILSIFREVDMRQSAEDRIEDLDETNFIIGYNLDVDNLIYNEILVNWPMKTLCDEACKGICRKCGANLNHSTCDCETAELDPRMAVIAEIFKNCN